MLAKECIKNWANWVPDSKRGFVETYVRLRQQGIRFDSDNKYFRDENVNLFIEHCKKNHLHYYEKSAAIQYSEKQIISNQHPMASNRSEDFHFQSQMGKFKNRDPKVDRVLSESIVLLKGQKPTKKEI